MKGKTAENKNNSQTIKQETNSGPLNQLAFQPCLAYLESHSISRRGRRHSRSNGRRIDPAWPQKHTHTFKHGKSGAQITHSLQNNPGRPVSLTHLKRDKSQASWQRWWVRLSSRTLFSHSPAHSLTLWVRYPANQPLYWTTRNNKRMFLKTVHVLKSSNNTKTVLTFCFFRNISYSRW